MRSSGRFLTSVSMHSRGSTQRLNAWHCLANGARDRMRHSASFIVRSCTQNRATGEGFGLGSFDGQAAQSTCSIKDGLRPRHELNGEVTDREARQLLELREYWPELLDNRKFEQELGDTRQVSASGKGTARVA